MAEEELKEYKILQLSTNGWFLIDDTCLHLTKEQATEKWDYFIAKGENPNDLKIVRQDDPRYPTNEPQRGFIPPPT